MNEPVLVTGATGFLGSHLCAALADDGVDVVALARESSDRSPLADADVRWAVGDVTDGDRMRDVVDGCESVFHLAGVGLATADSETVREVNVTGTERVFEACLENGVDRAVFTSTAGTRRTSGIATETDIATPVGAYQESKARAETVVDDAVDAGLDAVTVHPTSVFGPHDEAFTARLFTLASNPAMIAYVPGGASLVDIRDVVSGLRSAMDHGETGEHYILGGENLTFRAALSTIAEQIDGYAPRIPVPGPVLTAAGYVASALDNRLGVRVFPFTPEMGRLATSELFYSSKKAMDELGYTYRPLTEAVEPAAQWFQNR